MFAEGLRKKIGQAHIPTNAPQGQYKYDRDPNQDFGTDHTLMTHQHFLLDGKAHYLGVNLAKTYENHSNERHFSRQSTHSHSNHPKPHPSS